MSENTGKESTRSKAKASTTEATLKAEKVAEKPARVKAEVVEVKPTEKELAAVETDVNALAELPVPEQLEIQEHAVLDPEHPNVDRGKFKQAGAYVAVPAATTRLLSSTQEEELPKKANKSKK